MIYDELKASLSQLLNIINIDNQYDDSNINLSKNDDIKECFESLVDLKQSFLDIAEFDVTDLEHQKRLDTAASKVNRIHAKALYCLHQVNYSEYSDDIVDLYFKLFKNSVNTVLKIQEKIKVMARVSNVQHELFNGEIGEALLNARYPKKIPPSKPEFSQPSGNKEIRRSSFRQNSVAAFKKIIHDDAYYEKIAQRNIIENAGNAYTALTAYIQNKIPHTNKKKLEARRTAKRYLFENLKKLYENEQAYQRQIEDSKKKYFKWNEDTATTTEPEFDSRAYEQAGLFFNHLLDYFDTNTFKVSHDTFYYLLQATLGLEVPIETIIDQFRAISTNDRDYREKKLSLVEPLMKSFYGLAKTHPDAQAKLNEAMLKSL